MTTAAPQIGLFDLAEGRLGWIDARQRVLAQNIANADTPGYRARDVAPFADLVGSFEVQPARTSPLHLAGLARAVPSSRPAAGERAPDGNSVGIEGEMTKVADGETSQAAVANIWHSYMGMFMTALGRAG